MERLHENNAFKKIALRYPHIGIKVKMYWGMDDFYTYMHELFTDTRNGERRGFPAEDLALIHELKAFHDSLFRQEDVWKFAR